MAHPFFEELVFPAYRDEAKNLHRVLCIVVNTPIAATNLYVQCGPGLPGLTPANIDNTWHEALRNLAATGYLKMLCDLFKNLSQNPKVQEAIIAIENAKPAIEQTILESNVLMIDREPLRKEIKRMAPKSPSAKVLIVKGEPKSGKSYTEKLFSSTALSHGAEPVFLYPQIIPTLKMVLKQLYTLFGKEPPDLEKANTTDSAWYQEIVTTLRGFAAEQNKMYWIAVDDLGKNNFLPDTVLTFFYELALNVKDPQFSKRFRLLYIHFPQDVLRLWEKNIYTLIELKESDIKLEDLEEVLTEWKDKTGKTLSEEKIKTLATKVLANAENEYAQAKGAADENDMPSRLEFIHDRLLDELETLENIKE
jgi:hypothetical protein